MTEAEYNQKFKEIRNDYTLNNKSIDGYCFDDNDVWEQICKHETLKMFKPYYFCNQKHGIISIKGKTPKKLKPFIRNGYEQYCLRIIDKSKPQEYIEFTHITGILFDAEMYGKAKAILEKDGIKAFGLRGKDNKLQAHHINGKNNNSADNIEFLTERAHSVLESVPDSKASEDDKLKYMLKISDLAEREAPDKITIIPEPVDNNDAKKLIEEECTPEIQRGLELELLEHSGFTGALRFLVKEKGLDYFKQPKVVYFYGKFNLKCTLLNDDKMRLERVNSFEKVDCILGPIKD